MNLYRVKLQYCNVNRHQKRGANMINLKPTANHLKNIKEHKRFLEKWDMWEFAYFDGYDYYFVVQYTRRMTDSITGYIILNTEGEALPFDQVEVPAYNLILYNTMVHNTISDMIPQMHKGMKPFQQMYDLLNNHQSEMVKACPNISESIEKIIESISLSLKQPEITREIVYTLGGYQRQITRERGYFDLDFLKVMQDEAGKYSEMMYKYGLREIGLRKDYDRIYDCLKSSNTSIPKRERKKLMGLIKACTESNDNQLRKSLRTFEIDEQGNELYIDLKSIKESLARNREEIGKRDFQKIIVQIIRNKNYFLMLNQ